MSHKVQSGGVYHRLQARLDQHVTGAPESPVFRKILRLLFSEEDAALAARLPLRLKPLDVLSRRLGVPLAELDARVTEMAQRGLLLDVEMKGRRYACLAPVVIGFFEFTFMRVREDAPMGQLARLFEVYMGGGPFLHAVFQGETQIGRSLVHEEALPEGDHTEILDYERATRIVEDAPIAAVSLCACRHAAGHLGRACEAPLRCCLSFGYAAQVLARSGNAEVISNAEAMRILEESKAGGLAQTADNVQRQVSYICNCCGCCCGMFQAIRRFDIRHAVVTSNWIAEIAPDLCRGCGRCATACPIGAIAVAPPLSSTPTRGEDAAGPLPACGEGRGGGSIPLASRDESLCLGCGVCASACRFGAIRMAQRARRVIPPETAIERTLIMAAERGKLADLIFDDPERLSIRALHRLASAVERSAPVRSALSSGPIRSAFVGALSSGVRWYAGRIARMVE